jgi:hypothetical protein
MQEARAKSLLATEVTEVAKAVSLAAAGAQAEGKMTLDELCHRHFSSGKVKAACSVRKSLL